MPRKKKPDPVSPEPTIYTVYLDGESFAWLLETIEAKLKYQYLPSYLALVRKTLVSFQEAQAAVNGDQPVEPLPPAPVRKRVIPRRKP